MEIYIFICIDRARTEVYFSIFLFFEKCVFIASSRGYLWTFYAWNCSSLSFFFLKILYGAGKIWDVCPKERFQLNAMVFYLYRFDSNNVVKLWLSFGSSSKNWQNRCLKGMNYVKYNNKSNIFLSLNIAEWNGLSISA